MAHPFEVAPDEIERLDGGKLQRLLNRLLEIEVFQAGLSADALVASDRPYDSDGGIDAQIRAPDFEGSEFLPAGCSVWQAKAGKGWPDYQSELRKNLAREAVEKGYAYVIVLGRQMNAKQHGVQTAKLRAAMEAINPQASFEIRSASQVATWATRYPTVWRLLRRPPRPFWSVEDFLAEQELHNVVEYYWSPATESLRDAVRSQILNPASNAPLRVCGEAGVGKTRLVLETFAEPSSTAVYVPFVEDLSVEVLSWMRHRPGLTATLIVDECSLPDAEHIQTYISSAKGAIRLVAIGRERPPDRQNYFEVAPMDDDVVRKVVHGIHPQITLEEREWIVQKCGGFVKLARRLAELDIILSDLDVPGLLGEMFTDEQRDALTVVALLSHIGWDNELAVEGQALSQHMGIEWRKCRRVVQEMEKRGYIGRTGRYRYVTPELLAIWFAAEEWRANHRGLLDIFSQASPEMADRMLDRIRQMPHVDEVADLAEEVLGPNGPFRDLANLNHPRSARLFGDFSRVAPAAAIEALEHVFDGLDDQALHDFDLGRREIVWTLERLVAHREFFPSAARLLLRLAVAENEGFANNATGVFQSLFSPTGRASAATGDERLDFLADLISADQEKDLFVAIGALRNMFGAHSGSIVSADSGGQPPPAPWLPQSREERTEYYRRGFALLKNLLSHESAPVRTAAETAALEQFRSFFWLGLGEEALDLAARSGFSENLQRRLVLIADDIIVHDRDKAFMTDELLDGLQKLGKTIYADPLRERLHLRLGSWNRGLSAETEAREVKDLAAELFRQPATLRDEFDWITSEEAVKGQQFVYYLGEWDREREWLAPVRDASLARNRPDLISSYLLGLSRKTSVSEVDALLDRWASDESVRHLVPHVTAMLGLTERGVTRLLDLLDGGLEPQILTCLAWSRCESDLALETLAALLRAMAAGGTGLRSAVWTILSHNVARGPDGTETTDPARLDLLWELAGDADLIGDFADRHRYVSYDGDASYSWSECVKPLATADPRRLVAAIASAVQAGRERLYVGSYARKAMELCFEADPIGAWTAYADAVAEASAMSGWALTTWGAEAGIIEVVGVVNLQRWVEAAGEEPMRRAELVAKLTTVDTELTPLIRWIVTSFGDSEEILGSLMAEHGTRWSWGSLAAAEEPRLDAARQWAEDDDPRIRRWALRVVEDLQQTIKRERIFDEESELLR